MTASAPLLIFIVTYLLIAVQPVRFLHLNRPAASLLGAVAMVVLGGLPLAEAYAAIDLDVLVFLLGLMILVGYLEEGGFFEVAAEWLLERVTTPRRLLVGVVLGSGVLSALFVNDTICLVVTPVLVATLGSLGVRPAPYLIALAMGANVGSVLAFTGNPQNMLIGLWSGIPFARFSLHMLPVVAGALVLTCAVLVAIYWRELDRPFPRRAELPPVTLDRSLVLTALLLFAGAVVAWLLGGNLPLVAITAGALMVALAGRDPAPALARIEWSLLLLFGALFVVMRGLERSGAVGFISAEGSQAVSLGGPWASALAVSGVMLTLSNLISNVPAVILWRHVVPRLPHPELIWQLMAMSATFAGNLLMIGSAANLIVAERAEARGVKLGYGEYARAGVPVTLVTMAWGIVTLVVLASR